MRRAAIALAKLGYLSVTSTTLKRLLPPDDEYEDEITVMADVRAYFHVAYKVSLLSLFRYPIDGAECA